VLQVARRDIGQLTDIAEPLSDPNPLDRQGTQADAPVTGVTGAWLLPPVR